MACNIQYSNSETPIGVYNSEGNPSRLFQKINSNPHLTFEQAVDAYINVMDVDDSTPLTYQNPDGATFTSFPEALRNTNAGNIIAKVGDTTLFSISSDTNTRNFNGLLNNLIKSELLTGETFIDVDGNKIYTVEGYSDYKKAITSDSAIHTARGSVGYAAKRTTAGNLYFDTNLIGQRPILNENDEVIYVTQEQLDDKSYQQLKRESSDAEGLLAERAYRENNRAFGNVAPIEEIEIVPENELVQKLLILMGELGIRTVSLENYMKQNNVASDAQALADIANKLIAFKDGKINVQDLTEEVAHFIVEATDETQLENLLRNIHKTEEWAQYEATYRQIYSQEYAAEEVDNIVRREILGKVLANALQTNFAQEKTPTQNTIIERLRDIFNNFFDKIRAFFKPIHQQQLDSYTESIYRNLMSESLYGELNPEQLDGKKFVLYSAPSTSEYRALEKTLNQLINQQYQLAKKYSAPASQNALKEAKEQLLIAINATEEEIQKTAKQKALLNIATVANAQINYLNRVIDQNDKKGYHFAQEEYSVYQNLVRRIEPALAQINNSLSKDKTDKVIKSQIEQALKRITELKGKIPSNNEVAIENIVNRVITKNNVTGAEETRLREQLKAVLTAANQDTNWFHAHLGQLVNSQNILLNLAGDTIAKTVADERRYFLPRIKQFMNEIEAAGFDLRKLKTLIDGNGYIVNEVDNSLLEAIDNREQRDIYNSVATEPLTVEFTPSVLDNLNPEQRNLFDKAWQAKKKERLETFFTQEHIDKLADTFVEVNGERIYRRDLPAYALEYDELYRGQLTQIRINNGGVNTDSDAYEISQLNKQRIQDSNPRNSDGSLKKGLIELYENGEYVIALSPNLNQLSDEDILEAQKVFGLNTINLLNKKFYTGAQERGEIPQSFLDKIDEFETEQEKWNFVTLNAYVGFNADYWENFGQNETLRDRLERAKDGDNDTQIEEIIQGIRNQQQVIANILRAHRMFNQPSETNVADMHEIQTTSVRDAAIQLESLYNKANTFLPQEEQIETEPFSESRTNEAYRQDIADEKIETVDERIAFILRHVTPNNASNIREAMKVVDKIRKGESDIFIRKSLQNTFNEEMSVTEAEQMLIEYAEKKLLPYYKRTEPIGFTNERNALLQGLENNTPNTVRDFITNSEFTQVSPSYSFYGESDIINPKWLANKEAKRPQYTEEFAAKIRNDKYFQRYGINSQGRPTTNLQEWKAREALLNLQDWTIENYNLTGRHNRYLLPQQHKSGTRRVTTFLGNLDLKSVKEGIKDLVNFREDETEVGRDEEGNIVKSNSDLLAIPVYGTRKIENPNDVTDELLYSYAWMAQQSALHRARRENISDMLVIQDAVLNADYTGKSAESTNTYKMFRSFMNSNYYGIQESFNYEINLLGKKVNLGKLAKVFNSWVRFINLTGIVVPLTSLFQSSIQKGIEGRIQETVNPIASKLGNAEFLKTASGAAGETMSLTSKSKLNTLMEAYGVVDLVDSRYKNSNYERGIRTMLGAARGLHSLGNFPVLPRVALTILNDYRYYNGQIVSMNQYIRQNPSVTRKQAIEDWQKLDLFYNDIIVKDGVQSYNMENIAAKTSYSQAQLDKLHEAITNRIGAAIQDIDSQIRPEERSIAQRDARAAFLLMHMSWFTLGWQRKTANYHYDTAKDIWTEGSWRTTANFVKDLVVKRRNVKEAWKEAMADPTKRRNLNRTLLELGVANSLAVLAILLSQYVDDDPDDPLYAVAFADYMLTRVTNEQISSSVALGRQIFESASNPVIALERFTDLGNITDVFSGEEVTRGSFAGETERYRWISKNVAWAKDIHRLRDPKKAADTYQYFNNEVLENWTISAWLLEPDEDE